MGVKGFAITMGLGIAAGAVAIMMVPRNSSARKLATKTANKVEDVASKVSDKISHTMDQMM